VLDRSDFVFVIREEALSYCPRAAIAWPAKVNIANTDSEYALVKNTPAGLMQKSSAVVLALSQWQIMSLFVSSSLDIAKSFLMAMNIVKSYSDTAAIANASMLTRIAVNAIVASYVGGRKLPGIAMMR